MHAFVQPLFKPAGIIANVGATGVGASVTIRNSIMPSAPSAS
jgi:hypothetical protein